MPGEGLAKIKEMAAQAAERKTAEERAHAESAERAHTEAETAHAAAEAERAKVEQGIVEKQGALAATESELQETASIDLSGLDATERAAADEVLSDLQKRAADIRAEITTLEQQRTELNTKLSGAEAAQAIGEAFDAVSKIEVPIPEEAQIKELQQELAAVKNDTDFRVFGGMTEEKIRQKLQETKQSSPEGQEIARLTGNETTIQKEMKVVQQQLDNEIKITKPWLDSAERKAQNAQKDLDAFLNERVTGDLGEWTRQQLMDGTAAESYKSDLATLNKSKTDLGPRPKSFLGAGGDKQRTWDQQMQQIGEKEQTLRGKLEDAQKLGKGITEGGYVKLKRDSDDAAGELKKMIQDATPSLKRQAEMRTTIENLTKGLNNTRTEKTALETAMKRVVDEEAISIKQRCDDLRGREYNLGDQIRELKKTVAKKKEVKAA